MEALSRNRAICSKQENHSNNPVLWGGERAISGNRRNPTPDRLEDEQGRAERQHL